MAVEATPIFIQAGSHDAEHVRRFMDAMLDRAGIANAADLAVTQNGTPNMSVNVAAGRAFIPGTESTFQGVYLAENRSTLNVAIAAADATNPRKDLIVAKVRDAAYSGVSNDFSIVVVTGTPAPSPTEPAVPANALVLAMVSVAAAATSIVNANITDRRSAQAGQQGLATAAGGIIILPTGSGSFPPQKMGRAVYEQSSKKLTVSDGTSYLDPANLLAAIAASELSKKFMAGGPTNINATTPQTETTTTINFGATFAVAPSVVIVLGTTAPANPVVLRVTAVTTTSFTVGVRKADGSAFGANATYNIFWQAIG